MPYSSAQLSGLIGGQHAMFANQAAYSQQLGGVVGTGPAMGMAGMANPYPNYGMAAPSLDENMGARLAGGVGMALPGAVAGASIAAGFMGGKWGYADPFVGVARQFRAGMGMASSMGPMQVLGELGTTFRTGGARAGLGLLGRGGLAAGVAALPYMAVGAGVQKLGETFYSGARDVAEVGAMTSQYMSPQFGQPGAREGGRLSRSSIRSTVDMLNEIASDDTKQTVDSLKRLMDRAGQMGMFTGTTNIEQFKSRFKAIVNQTREVAKALGGTLEEALPMMNQLQSMGVWRGRDVMGTAFDVRSVGRQGAGNLLGTMQAGAQMGFQMGGSLGTGAMMGRESFMNIRAAVNAGILTDQQIRELTGGVGGTQGQQVLGTQMTGVLAQLGKTAPGRLMMAGLGQVNQEGQFTGQVDQDRLERFLSGELSFRDLSRMGERASRTQVGAMSFDRVQGQLGQAIGAQGGMEAVSQIMDQIVGRLGGGEGARGEEMQHQILKKVLGLSDRQATMWKDLLDKIPQMREQRLRTAEATIEERFRRMDERSNRSFSGLVSATNQAMDNFWRPVREAGSDLATKFGEMGDEATRFLLGRVTRIPMTHRERMRRLVSMGPGAQGLTEMGLGDYGADELDTPLAELMKDPNLGFFGGIGANIRESFGGDVPGTRGSRLRGAGLTTISEDLSRVMGGSFIDVGGGQVADRASITAARRRQRRRAQATSLEGVGLGKDTAERARKVNNVAAEVRRLIWDPKTSRELKRLKEENPDRYNLELIKMLRTTPAGKDMEDLIRDEGTGTDDSRRLDVLAVAKHAGEVKGELAPEFGESTFPFDLSDSEAVSEHMEKQVDVAMHAAGNKWWSPVASTSIDALTTFFGGSEGSLGGGWLRGLGEAAKKKIGAHQGVDLSREEIRTLLTGDMGQDILKTISAMESGRAPSSKNKFVRAAEKRGSLEEQLKDALADDDFREAFKASLMETERVRGGQAVEQQRERLRALSEMEQSLTQKDVGIKGDKFELLQKIIDEAESGGAGVRDRVGGLSEILAGGLKPGEIDRLAKGKSAFGRNVAAMGRAMGIESGISEKDFRRLTKGIESASIPGLVGMSLKGMDAKGMFEDGLTREEAGKMREAILESLKRLGATEGTKGRQAAVNTFNSGVDKFNEAIDKFAGAVDKNEEGVMTGVKNTLSSWLGD